MRTLLLRLAGPLQAWGVDAKFNKRSTERMPSKSGVIGLVASALGRGRDDDLSDLSALLFGVRADQPGTIVRDYQTVHEEAFWRNKDGKYAHITERYYLGDAVFVAGLSGNEDLLLEIDAALQNPHYPLYLGRRSCPPEGRISLGMREGKSLREALSNEPWQASLWFKQRQNRPVRLEVAMDLEAHDSVERTFFQRDLPLTFDQRDRRYGFRQVYSTTVSLVDGEHDPMQAF